MVVIVTGASGQLGQSLQTIAPHYPAIVFHFFDATQLDITQSEACTKIFEQLKPNFCINAAAYTAVDKAEAEPEKAHLINAIGPKNLAEVCKKNDCTLLHISTDFVFDGSKQTPYTENDMPHPLGVYGQTKLEGEAMIQAIWQKHFIIRTAWVYSQFGNNFMKTMLRLATERDTISVVNDQIGAPTHALDLAEGLLTIMLSCWQQPNENRFGLYNFSNEGSCSWYEFALAIFDHYGIKIDVTPIPTANYPTPAVRPKYSVLDKTKIKSAFKIDIKHWDTRLQEIQTNL